MSATTAQHPYIEALLKGSRALPAVPVSWLNTRRGEALERANALSVPTTRDEEWRFTDITPLTRLAVSPAAAAAPQIKMAQIAHLIVPEASAHLTFVDGVFSPELSATAGLPYGVAINHLAAAVTTHGAVIEPQLARHAGFERDFFSALNTAHLHDGAFIWIAKNQKCPTPVQVLYLSTRHNTVAHPRCLVLLEPGAECTLIEDFVALADGAYFTNAVTELVLGDNARLQHVRLQREAATAFHIATCAVAVARDATYVSNSVSLGARISRYNLDVSEQGEGAACRIDGLALIRGRQLADTHTSLDHRCPNTRSEQLHKTIVNDAAHAVFNGKVLVREGAQLTNSAQQSRNLLLSARAHVDTKPQLEIFADDVKCAHGATVGQLDAEHVFYLKSRGLSESRARNLLTYAFGAEVIDRIPVPSLVENLEQIVLEQTQTEL